MQNKQWIKMETVKNGYKISHMHSGNVKKSLTQAGCQNKLCFPKYIYDGQWPSIEACPNSCTTCIGDWTTLYSLHLFRGYVCVIHSHETATTFLWFHNCWCFSFHVCNAWTYMAFHVSLLWNCIGVKSKDQRPGLGGASPWVFFKTFWLSEVFAVKVVLK
jgi:hypothetical protein